MRNTDDQTAVDMVRAKTPRKNGGLQKEGVVNISTLLFPTGIDYTRGGGKPRPSGRQKASVSGKVGLRISEFRGIGRGGGVAGGFKIPPRNKGAGPIGAEIG